MLSLARILFFSSLISACTTSRDLSMDQDKIMEKVIDLAAKEVEHGGLPFATIVTNKDGQIIAEAVNTVQSSHDPTDHAEIRAIRLATQKLGRSHLAEHAVYVIGHPCPMCLAALIYAKPAKVYFAVTIAEKDQVLKNVNNGIDILSEMKKAPEQRTLIPMQQVLSQKETALAVFKAWAKKDNEQKKSK